MSYVVSTKEEQAQMLKDIGIENYTELFKDVPKSVLLKKPLEIPEGISEFEVLSCIEKIASKNRLFDATFRGAGSYNHLIPEVVKHLSSLNGFVTSYTPYQAEISQGSLQALFEYQSEICDLFDMEVTNSSVYDGGSAAGESMIMTLSRNTHRFLVSDTVHPNVKAVLKTYAFAKDIEIVEIKSKNGLVDLKDLEGKITDDTSAVLVQNPNYFGLIENLESIVKVSHDNKIQTVVYANPIASSAIKTPGSVGVDIVCGDAQPLGLDRAFGGPYVGFIATTKKNVRKLPGRIVGQTVDEESKRSFVLTLQAREQHIRREKASSSICSNQALAALRCAIYMAAMGKTGLKEVATHCLSKSHYAAHLINEIDGYKLKYDCEFFDEFVVDTRFDVDKINLRLKEENIEGPLKIDNHTMLVCVTEAVSKDNIDKFISILKEASTWS